MASSRSLLFSFATRETSNWRELKNARSSTVRSRLWAGLTTTSMEKPFILPCEAKNLSIDTCRVWASPIVLVQQSRAGFWTLGTLVVTESPLATDNFSARSCIWPPCGTTTSHHAFSRKHRLWPQLSYGTPQHLLWHPPRLWSHLQRCQF